MIGGAAMVDELSDDDRVDMNEYLVAVAPRGNTLSVKMQIRRLVWELIPESNPHRVAKTQPE